MSGNHAERFRILRSGFFWRLYLAFLVIVLLTASVIGALVVRQIESTSEEQIAIRLRSQATALIPLGNRVLVEGFDGQKNVEAVGRDSATRITIVRIDGLVVADSEELPERMDDHSGRPEILAALASGSGSAKRFSVTAQRDLMYVAVRLDRDGGPALGVVRVAMSLTAMDAEIGLVRQEVIRGALIGILVALVISAFIVRRIVGPIAEMTRVSEALQREDYSLRVTSLGPAEIGTLGDNLNRLAERLVDRMATLSHQQAQIGAIVSSMEEGVLAIDAQRMIIASNSAGRELLGLPDGPPTILSNEHLARTPDIAAMIAAAERGHAAHREITLGTAEGEVVLDARANPFSANQNQGVILVFYNISNLRRLERVRTDFVANVSHELKTPLTSIQGYVETLLDGAIDDSDNNVRFLEKIRGHVRRLGSLVSDLLSLARIESSSGGLASEPVDWRDVVSESAAQRGDPAAARRLGFELDLAGDAVMVIGDPEAMRQVVDNLLDNAINYTGEGGTVRVVVSGDGASGRVRIEDTGIGVPSDALDRIFERFYRVDRGRSRDLGGTGLGLSIVRNLLSRMNGTIEVESAVGVGSAFTVTLPTAHSRVDGNES